MERFGKFSGTAIGLILALTALVFSFLAPYLLNGKVGPLGFPWVFVSSVISQFLVLLVCVYVAVFLWRTKRGCGR